MCIIDVTFNDWAAVAFIVVELNDELMGMMCLCYCIVGLWSSPSMKGSRPPPCSSFSLTMTDEDQAVMFGGLTSSFRSFSEARILHLPTMVS